MIASRCATPSPPRPPLERKGENLKRCCALRHRSKSYARPGFVVLTGAAGLGSTGEDSAGVALLSIGGFAVCGELGCLVPPSCTCFRFGDSAGEAGLVLSLCSCAGTEGSSRLRS